MNPLEYIQQYTKPLSEAANMLRQLASPLMPLPSMEHLQSIKDRLLEIHPADVTAKLAWEDKVESKRRFIIDGLQGFLNIDAGIGAVLIDGVEYDYWDGMNDKLAVLDKAEVEAYTNLIVAISNIIHDSTNGMRNDINYLFNEIVFEDRNMLASNPDAHRVDDSLNLPSDFNSNNIGRPKGRPIKSILGKLNGNKEERQATLKLLHKLIVGKRGRDVALIILGAIRANKMSKPTFSQLQEEFGDIGNVSGYNRYIRERDNLFTDDEISTMAKRFYE